MPPTQAASDEIVRFVGAIHECPCVRLIQDCVETSDTIRVFVESGFLLEFYNTHRTPSEGVMSLLLSLRNWTRSSLEPIVRSVLRRLCRSVETSTTCLRFACRVRQECPATPTTPLRVWTCWQLEAMQCEFHTLSSPEMATLLLHLIDALGLQVDMIDLDVCEVMLEVILMTFIGGRRGRVSLDTECVLTRLLTTVVQEFPFVFVYSRLFALHWLAIVPCIDVHTSLTLLQHTGTALLLVILRCVDVGEAHTFLRSQEERDLAIQLWPDRFGPAFDASWTRATPSTDRECPITLEPMVYPVIASDGHVYECDAILTHLLANNMSPLTRESMDYTVVPAVFA